MRLFKKTLVTDRAWVEGGRLYCRFERSGQRGGLSVFALDTLGEVTIDGAGEEAVTLNADARVIDKFQNPAVAKEALDLIERALFATGRPRRRLRTFASVGLPIMVVLGFIMVFGGGGQSGPAPQVQSPLGVGGIPPLANFPQGGMDKLASDRYEAMLRDVKAGRQPDLSALGMGSAATPGLPSMFPAKVKVADVEKLNKIAVGNGKPQFYVFADPTCPSCKELDASLKQMNIPFAVVPVAVRGDDAALRATRVMCAKDQTAAWEKQMAGGDVSLETQDRKALGACAQKVIDNMNAFKVMGMTATPTVVNAATGRVGIPQSPQEIEELKK